MSGFAGRGPAAQVERRLEVELCELVRGDHEAERRRVVLRARGAGGQGVYHASAEGYGTWFALARHFLASIGVDKPLKPCPSSDFPTPAGRPRNSILENRRLKEAGLNLMRPWQEDLDEFVTRFREDLLQEARAALAKS